MLPGDVHPSAPGVDTWEVFAGVSRDAPALAAWGQERLDLFVTGQDHRIYHKWFDGQAWRPSAPGVNDWEVFAGHSKHGPAVAWGPGRLDLFVTGNDNRVYHKWFDGQNWHPSAPGVNDWEIFAGHSKHGPAVAAWGPGRLDLFVTGNDDRVYQKWFQGRDWRPGNPASNQWQVFEGSSLDSPAVAARGPGRLELFVTGRDRRLYRRLFDGRRQPGASFENRWDLFEGVSAHGPAVASWALGRLDLFVTGGDGRLYQKWFDR